MVKGRDILIKGRDILIKGRDILIIGIQPWDISIGSNCKNIAKEFSKDNRVLYVNEPLNRWSRIRNNNKELIKKRIDIIKGKKPGLQQVDKNLWNLNPQIMIESINWLPPSYIYNYLNKRNNRIFFNEVKKALEYLSFRDIILFNDSLMFLGFYFVEFLKPKISIYYIRDNLVSQNFFKKHGKNMEPQLAKKYDAVVSNSDYLANYLSEFNNKVYMVGQGCDLILFEPKADEALPHDISDLPHPIIGYVGYLTGIRLDIPLIINLATKIDKGCVVLIGPEDDEFKNSKLHQMKNVYFLGNKKMEDLPRYIAAFDVAINPQAVNEMTIGNYPRKVDEYLAMGKPVVATFTEAMQYFKDYVYLSSSPYEFPALVQKALNENNDSSAGKRIEFAKSHTWKENVKQIYKVIISVQNDSIK